MGSVLAHDSVIQVMDRVRDAFYSMDPDWRFTIINRAAEQYIGRPRDELLGKVLWDEFPQLRGTQIEHEYRHAVATQQDREFELLTPILQRWVDVRVFPSPEGISVYFVDVTARKQAQDALRASEAEYRALFEHSLDGILLTNPNGEILDANPAACRMLQRTRQEITAEGRTGIVDTSDPRLPVLLERRKAHGFARGELLLVRKDGTRFPVELASTVFTDGDGGPRTSMTFRDLTETKRDEEALRLLAQSSVLLQTSLDVDAVLETLTTLVVPAVADLAVVDLVDGTSVRRFITQRGNGGDPLVDVVRASAPDHLTERGVSRVLRTCDPELVPVVTDDYLRRVARDPEHLAALRAMAPSSCLMVPLMARGALIGVLTLAHLDPARRPFDGDDLALARGLADRAALSLDNARLYAGAVEQRKLRDEMLGIVSHDLRTPLNAIALQAQLLARRHPSIDLGPILLAARHAERLVQDLLTISALDAGKLPLELKDEDLHAMLSEVVELHRAIAGDRGLTLELDCVPELGRARVDRKRIVQALSNLVGNAIKFTPPDGTIALRASRAPGEVRIEITDTGTGIEPGEIAHLFDRFWRGRHGAGGVGLGLAITKGVVEAHGGRVTLKSQVGAGTTFTIVIPTIPPGP